MKMPPCPALGCKNRHSMKLKGVTYHRFPQDPYRRQQWILAVRRADWAPSKSSRLCSMHFEEHMFDRNLPSQLKKTAVPTIFEGVTPIENKELLKPKIEILEDISNNKNRILVVPEHLDLPATFYDNDDKNNVVIIKDEEDLQTVLNYGTEGDIDDNRTIIVSDGRNTKTEWCGNGGGDSHPNGETPPYDPKFGEESLKSDFVDYSKVRTVLAYDPGFYVRRVKNLDEAVKKLQMKKKLMHQMTRRRQKKIVILRKQVRKIENNVLPSKCSTQPIVHVISQVVNN